MLGAIDELATAESSSSSFSTTGSTAQSTYSITNAAESTTASTAQSAHSTTHSAESATTTTNPTITTTAVTDATENATASVPSPSTNRDPANAATASSGASTTASNPTNISTVPTTSTASLPSSTAGAASSNATTIPATTNSAPTVDTTSLPSTIPATNESIGDAPTNPADTNYCLSHFSVLNIHGLKPQTVPSKVPYIESLLKEKNQLFMGLTETWLKGHTQAELRIDGYRLYRADRTGRVHTQGRYSGGAAIYLRADIANTTEQVLKFSNGVVEALVLHSQRENLLIAIVYRQPDNKFHRSQAFQLAQAITKIEETIEKIEGSPSLILCGDFNLPNINWSEGQPHDTQNKMVTTLATFQSRQLLSQMIKQPTHSEGNILDLIFTNDRQLFSEINCIPTSKSDHFIVEVSTHFKSHFAKSRQQKRTFFNVFDAHNFFSEDVDWDAIRSELKKTEWQEDLAQMDSAADMLNLLISTCEEIGGAHAPKKKSDKSKKHLIPRDRRILMRRRRKITKQLRIHQPPSRKKTLDNELISIEEKLQESYNKSHDFQERKAIQAIKRNPKYFFTYVKKLSKVKTAIGPLKDSNGSFISDSKDMANILKEQYSAVFSKPVGEDIDPELLFNIHNDPSKLTDINFSPADIVWAIEEISPNSAPGPDGFPAIFLNKCKQELATPLYRIWRKNLDEQSDPCPTRVKQSLICPIHKGDSTALPKNYRPVALTSLLVKVFEKILRKHIVDYLDQNDLFNPTQHGFRSGRSCLSQLIAHYDKVLSYLEEGKNVDVIYLDFAKAFDKLDFNITLAKIKDLGIDGKIGRWLHSFLTGRHQTVIVNGERSEPAPVISGVPQGSVIGPLLFLILIGDIDKDVAHSFISSFADDTRIGREIASPADARLLQEDLHKVYNWATTNNMQFNDTKFELLRYGKNYKLKESTSYLSNNNQQIEAKASTKDLGITISATADFDTHISNIIDTVKELTAWILRSFKTRSKVVMLQLWKSVVLPRLDYCSQLWNPSKAYLIKQLEDLQKNFVRHIRGFANLEYESALEKLGLYSLKRRRERYQVIYLWCILEGYAPNIYCNNQGLIRVQSALDSRRGRTIGTKALRSSSHFSTLRFKSLPFAGARLFNSLPKNIRNITGCSKITFKNNFDTYLKTIPDQTSNGINPSSLYTALETTHFGCVPGEH